MPKIWHIDVNIYFLAEIKISVFGYCTDTDAWDEKLSDPDPHPWSMDLTLVGMAV